MLPQNSHAKPRVTRWSAETKSFLRSICGYGAALLIATAGAAAEKQPPNVLLIVADDLRADAIRALGRNTLVETPHLDALAKRSAVFPRATCANPICVMSRAEILTGCSTMRPRVVTLGQQLTPPLALWPQTMRKAGYHTWYVGKWHNSGLPSTRGYEDSLGLFIGSKTPADPTARDANGRPITGYVGWVFADAKGRPQPERGVGLTPDITRTFAESAIEFLKRPTDRPFFLHVNFTAPHDPLLIPPGYEKKYLAETIALPVNFLPEHPFDHGNLRGRDEQLLPWPRTPEDVRRELRVYYAIVSHMDEQVGRILAALEDSPAAKNTIVIFTSDHGLAIGSHGLRGKQNMYEHTINVPLLIRASGVAPGVRQAQCYLRDLYPTICDLAGIPTPKTVEGKSLKPVLAGTAKSIYPCVFGYFTDTQRMIRTDHWKLIHYPKLNREQLFDMIRDPDEMRDLIADPKAADIRRDLGEKLRDWQKDMEDPVLESKP